MIINTGNEQTGKILGYRYIFFVAGSVYVSQVIRNHIGTQRLCQHSGSRTINTANHTLTP